MAQSSKITAFQEWRKKRKSGKGDFDEGNYQDALSSWSKGLYEGQQRQREAVDNVGNFILYRLY
jgi:hypothetical protein